MTSHAGSGSEEKKVAESDRGTTFRNTFGTVKGDADDAKSSNSVGRNMEFAEDKVDGEGDDYGEEELNQPQNFTRTFIDQAGFSYFTTLKH